LAELLMTDLFFRGPNEPQFLRDEKTELR